MTDKAMLVYYTYMSLSGIIQLFCGISLFLFGMKRMSESLGGPGNSSWFTGALSTLSNPFLGIIIGAAAAFMLFSIGAYISGKRAALVYPVAAMLGVIFFSSLISVLHRLSMEDRTSDMFDQE